MYIKAITATKAIFKKENLWIIKREAKNFTARIQWQKLKVNLLMFYIKHILLLFFLYAPRSRLLLFLLRTFYRYLRLAEV